MSGKDYQIRPVDPNGTIHENLVLHPACPLLRVVERDAPICPTARDAPCEIRWIRVSSDLMSKLRWGILGTGNIARQFATGVRASRTGVLAAVGSRSPATAEAFARQFEVPVALGSYDALIQDRSYDALYVSLPNSMHYEWTIKALRAGKHVLCEKPISVTAAEAQEMFAVAQQTGRVLVEAFMYRAHPQTIAAVEAIRSGAIGTPRLVRTSFCYRTRKIEGNIRFDPTLAGGALMDIGCYCISFARLIAGAEPTQIEAIGLKCEQGVDISVMGQMRFPGDLLATFTCSMNTQADNAAQVCGDEGYLTIPVPWKPPAGKGQVLIERQIPPKQDGGAAQRPASERIAIDDARDVYAVEADAFADVIAHKQPPFVLPAESVGNMLVIERVRSRIGAAVNAG